MLYFIKSLNYLKVGYSLDFETLISRILSYMTHNPNFTLLSFTEFGTKKDETFLHRKLKDYLYYTEWFLDELKVYEIWEKYINDKNLIPKNCFFQFPDDIEKLKNLNYKQTWDSPLITFSEGESITKEEEEIILLKYFLTYKTFTYEDFIRACKFCLKQTHSKIDKSKLESFGYIFNEFSDDLVTVKKIKFVNINLKEA